MKKMEFIDWSQAWEAAKARSGDIKGVLDLWGNQPDKSWVGNEWKDKTPGFRKTHKSGVGDSGEQVLEHKLLGNRGHLKLHTLVDKRKGEAVYPLVAVYNNMPWTRMKKGQVRMALS